MKIWVDDLRPMPEGYDKHCKSLNETKETIWYCERFKIPIDLIDLDHDLGDYVTEGGDAIRLMDYLLERQTFYPLFFHTANPVGLQNMQRMYSRHWLGKIKTLFV